MDNTKTKRILPEPKNDEQLKLIEAFIREQKIKAFVVEDSKPNTYDALDDVLRVLVPIMR